MRDVFWIFHRIIVQCSTGVKTESEITVKENLGRYTRCSLVTTLCRLKCVMCAAWQRYSKARSTPVTMSKQHCRMLERWSPYSKMPPKSLKNRQKWLEYSHCCCLRIASVGYAAAISIRFPCTGHTARRGNETPYYCSGPRFVSRRTGRPRRRRRTQAITARWRRQDWVFLVSRRRPGDRRNECTQNGALAPSRECRRRR